MTEAYSYRADKAVPAFPDDRPLIVFDGVCGLCSGFVRFVLRHDKRGQYRFLAAQSDLATSANLNANLIAGGTSLTGESINLTLRIAAARIQGGTTKKV